MWHKARSCTTPGLTLETLIVPLVTQNTGRETHPPSPLLLSNPTSEEKLSQKAQISALTGCCSKLPSRHLNKYPLKGTLCNSLDSPHTPPITVNGVKRLSIRVNQSEAYLPFCGKTNAKSYHERLRRQRREKTVLLSLCVKISMCASQKIVTSPCSCAIILQLWKSGDWKGQLYQGTGSLKKCVCCF